MDVIDDIGYGNAEMDCNGEIWVIKNFIKPDFIIFDIGANTGDWTRQSLAQQPKAIYAFEPVAKFRPNDKHIILVRTAVGSINETKMMCVAGNNLDLSSFYKRPSFNGNFYQICVPVTTLDDYCKSKEINKIDFLKIDVEGAEHEVLLGAQNLLKEGKIIHIQFEYGGTYTDAGTTLKNVYELLIKYNYSVSRILPAGLLPVKQWDDRLEVFKYSNYLAIMKSNLE